MNQLFASLGIGFGLTSAILYGRPGFHSVPTIMIFTTWASMVLAYWIKGWEYNG